MLKSTKHGEFGLLAYQNIQKHVKEVKIDPPSLLDPPSFVREVLVYCTAFVYSSHLSVNLST